MRIKTKPIQPKKKFMFFLGHQDISNKIKIYKVVSFYLGMREAPWTGECIINEFSDFVTVTS